MGGYSTQEHNSEGQRKKDSPSGLWAGGGPQRMGQAVVNCTAPAAALTFAVIVDSVIVTAFLQWKVNWLMYG